MRHHSPAIQALLALLLVAAAPVDGAAPVGEFLAQEVHLPAGGALEGAFLAVELRGGEQRGMATFSASGDMTVEVDEVSSPFSVPPLGRVPGENSTTSERLGEAQAFLAGVPRGPAGAYSLLVRAAPGATVDAFARLSDLRLQRAGAATLHHFQSVPGPARPELDVPVAGSHQVSAAGELALDLEGDLFLSLYSLDLTVINATGARTYSSGQVPGPESVQLTGVAAAGPVDDRQVYLRISNGRLSLRAPAAAISDFYFDVARAATPGPVEMGAAVRVGQGPAAPSTVAVPGPAALKVSPPRGDGAIPVRVSLVSAAELSGLLEETGSDGATVASRLPWRAFGPVAVALAAAALTLALWASMLSRRRAIARMQILFGAGRYVEADAAARQVLGARRSSPDAALIRAISLLRLERPDEAERFLGRHRAAQQVEPATRDFLWACVRAQQGQPAEARRHLSRCLLADPGYRAEALDNPWLRSLVPAGRSAGPGPGGRILA